MRFLNVYKLIRFISLPLCLALSMSSCSPTTRPGADKAKAKAAAEAEAKKTNDSKEVSPANPAIDLKGSPSIGSSIEDSTATQLIPQGDVVQTIFQPLDVVATTGEIQKPERKGHKSPGKKDGSAGKQDNPPLIDIDQEQGQSGLGQSGLGQSTSTVSSATASTTTGDPAKQEKVDLSQESEELPKVDSIETDELVIQVDDIQKKVRVTGKVKVKEKGKKRKKEQRVSLEGKIDDTGKANLAPAGGVSSNPNNAKEELAVKVQTNCVNQVTDSCEKIVAQIAVQDVKTQREQVKIVKSSPDNFVSRANMFFTINPEFGDSGSAFSSAQIKTNPMYEVNTLTDRLDSEKKNAYITTIFRRLLRVCHESMAKLGTINEDPNQYWAQVAGCLLVPYHESHLTHFRKVTQLNDDQNESICSIRMNNGQFLSKNAKLYNVFRTYFKGANVVKVCSEYSNNEPHIQLVGSSDAYSSGIMQIAMNWHPQHIGPGGHLNINATLQYGLMKYLTAMKRIRLNSFKYSCLNSGNSISYFNLVRSAWSGDFNGGSDAKACRYMNAKDPWASNDKEFLANFNALLGVSGQTTLFDEGLTNAADLKMFRLIQTNMTKIRSQKAAQGELASSQSELLKYVEELGRGEN